MTFAIRAVVSTVIWIFVQYFDTCEFTSVD